AEVGRVHAGQWRLGRCRRGGDRRGRSRCRLGHAGVGEWSLWSCEGENIHDVSTPWSIGFPSRVSSLAAGKTSHDQRKFLGVFWGLESEVSPFCKANRQLQW